MRFIIDTAVIIVFALVAFGLYHMYWGTFVKVLFPQESVYSIYLGPVAVEATVADTDAERIQGLSGVERLGNQNGKFFIFDTDAREGIWMKDMKFPLDIMWIDKNLKIVHIEQDVDPNTYPEVFYPPVDARFVLEVNAKFVSTFRIKEGDPVTLPASLIPADIRANLRQI